jgi:hypothetical protein
MKICGGTWVYWSILKRDTRWRFCGLVNFVIKLRAAWPRNLENFSLHHRVQTDSVQYIPVTFLEGNETGLFIYLRLVRKLRMRGIVPPIPSTFSKRYV